MHFIAKPEYYVTKRFDFENHSSCILTLVKYHWILRYDIILETQVARHLARSKVVLGVNWYYAPETKRIA